MHYSWNYICLLMLCPHSLFHARVAGEFNYCSDLVEFGMCFGADKGLSTKQLELKSVWITLRKWAPLYHGHPARVTGHCNSDLEYSDQIWFKIIGLPCARSSKSNNFVIQNYYSIFSWQLLNSFRCSECMLSV